MEMAGNGHRIGMAYIAVKLKLILQALHQDLVKYIAEDVGITILNIVVFLVFDILILQPLGVLVRAFDLHCKWVPHSITRLLEDMRHASALVR